MNNNDITILFPCNSKILFMEIYNIYLYYTFYYTQFNFQNIKINFNPSPIYTMTLLPIHIVSQ